MDKCQDKCGGTRRRATSRPTPYTAEVLDKFDKGCNVVDIDHRRVVLNDQFCAVFKKDKHDNTSQRGGSSPNTIRRSSSAIPTKLEYRRRIFGPFDPNAGLRQLAYQPTEAEKNLDRKISSNTLHGVESVNDLRSWGFNKDERRQHYLEQMILESGTGGSTHQPKTTTPLLSYKETAAPIPVLRLQEQKENNEQGKTPAKAITEQYHQEMDKQSAAAPPPPPPPPPPPKEISTGTKEVQTPKLSITNLLEELTDDEKNRLFNLMKNLRGEEDGQGTTPAKAITEQYHQEMEKQSVAAPPQPPPPKEISSQTKEVQTPKVSIANLLEELTDDEKDRLFNLMKNLRGEEDDRAKSGPGGHDEELDKLRQQIKELEDRHKDAPQKTGEAEHAEHAEHPRKTSQENGKGGPSQVTSSQALAQNNTLQQEIMQLREQIQNIVTNEQELHKLLQQFECAVLERNRLVELNRSLEQEAMQLREQIQKMVTNEQELHKMLQQFECAVLERNGLVELNRSLEQEVMQLRMSPIHRCEPSHCCAYPETDGQFS